MDRWACVDAFSFPLQVVLSIHPEWLESPVAVVDRDSVQGRITHLNRRARSERLRPGMRRGQALSMVPSLRVDTADRAELARRSDAIAHTLGELSPRVEHDTERPGLFWLDVSGLETLYGDWHPWVDDLRARLRDEHGVYVCVVIGFRRFSTFAIARHTGRSGAFDDPRTERTRALAVPLSSLGLHPSCGGVFRRLDVRTVGELLDLPPEGLRRRLGDRIFELYRLARGDLQRPRPTHHSIEQPSHTDHLDHAVRDTHRLLFLIKRSLPRLLHTLEERGEKLRLFVVLLHRRDGTPDELEVRPAAPTLDEALVVDLLRLRLERLDLTEPVTDVDLTAHGQKTDTEQLRLFADTPPRDIDAANRALARLKSQFGPDAILRVRPADAHLPESRFELVPLDRLAMPEVQDSSARPAIRRFFPTPIHLQRAPEASIRAGPHTVSGGWWIREVHRDYHLTAPGERLRWIFYDHRRKRWYLHGEF